MAKNVATAIFKNAGLSVVLALSMAAMPAAMTRAADAPAEVQAEVGKKAPGFTLPDLDGKPISLSKFKGKFVVLEWFNDGCPFVKKHYNTGNMPELQKEFTKKGVVWLTICSSAEGKQGHHTVAEFKDILKNWKAQPSHFLVDGDGTVGHEYGAKTTPDMYILDKEQNLVYAGAIDDKPDTDVESVKTAKNYVRAALDEVMAGKQVATASTRSYGCSVKYKG